MITQTRLAFWIAAYLIVEQATAHAIGESLLAQQSQSPPMTTGSQAPAAAAAMSSPQGSVGQTPTPQSSNLETKVRPSVIWVTAFDAKGNLLRTETGFFVSADGKFVTTEHAIEGAANAVAKTGDGDIYNVSGILSASKSSGLAILQAEVKPRKLLRFLDVNKTSELAPGAKVTVIGSALAGSEGAAHEKTITGQSSDRLEIAGATPGGLFGSPVVNENGEVVGVIVSAAENTVARPSAALESILSRITADTQARWSQTSEARPTPHATPRPRLIYAPAPSFPAGQSLGGESGTGRFLLTFDPRGNVTNIKIVASTGNPYFDQAAVKTLRQWKSAPSEGWQATVPVTFRTR